MSHSTKVICKKCGYEEMYLEGIGMAYSSLLNVIESVPKRYREELRRGLETCELVALDFHRALYECPKCDIPYSFLFFEVENFRTQEISKPEYYCEKCKTKLILATKPIYEYGCKQCGDKEHLEHYGVLWD
jgi:hypothetical protein